MTYRLPKYRTEPDGENNADGPQILSLSLFIMLLSFFIVLTALSDFDESRAKAIVESVGDTFAPRVQGQETKTSLLEDVLLSRGEGFATERLRDLFRSNFPGAEEYEYDTQGILHVRMKLEEFIVATDDLTEADDTFVQKLRALFVLEEAGRPLRLDIVAHVGRTRDSVRAVARLAENLEAAGLPPRLMSVGVLEDSEKGIVDLFFRPHEPFNPLEGSPE